MSLLNQMLKDLDQRRAAGVGVPAMHRDIRPLPANPAPKWPKVLIGGLLGLAMAFGGWKLLGHRAASSVPESTTPVGNEANPAPAIDVAQISAGRTTSRVGNGLRLSDRLSIAAVRAPAATQVHPPSLALAAEPDHLPAPAAVSAPAAPAQAAPLTAPAPQPLAGARTSEGNIDKRALALNPREQAERLYRSAVKQVAQGHEQDGITTLRAALTDDPDHLPARQLLIKQSLDRHDYDLAQQALVEGLRRFPGQSGWAMLLSRLKVDRGDVLGALAVLETHEAFAAGAADYQGAMAAMLQRLNRPGEAEARYLKATQSDSANGRWWLGLAMAREAQGKVNEAREAFRSALAAKGLSAELRAFAEAKIN